MLLALHAQGRETTTGLFRAYGAILFAEKPWIGGLLMLATFWFPNAGCAGLLAAVVGMLTARLLQFKNLESGLHVYNSLLVGLSLGAYYQLDLHLGVLISLGAVLAVFATVAMADMAWRLGRLPILSLPFVIVALTVTLAAHSYGTLSRYLLPLAPHDGLIHPFVDQFLTALGAAFFTPHPIAGLLLFFGLLITSRYLALLAIAGFICGYSAYAFLSGSPHPDLVAWNGFNFILVAMALGGLFIVPSMQSFALAMVGSVLAALITAASETFMLVYGLPVMALPFLITSLTILLALTHRPASNGLQLILDAPALPEKSIERARLAIARHGEFGSVPVLAPFYGRWQVYQGFDGPHTHQAPWQHALDFYIVEEGQSYHTDGASLTDYFCFGLPVLAPVEGYVIKTLDSLPDNPPGQVDLENNWGNHVLIRMPSGLYVLLAHVKQGSVCVESGTYLHAGQQVAECGSSGRSPQPHLHLHVQQGEALGSATHPFHLTTVLHQTKTGESGKTKATRFKLFSRPDEGDRVMMPKIDTVLVESLKFNVGRVLCYQVTQHDNSEERTLRVVLNLSGQLRLNSDSGASAAFTTQDHLLAFYDRAGPADAFFDAWLLAVGLMPLTEGELVWHDQPSMQLLPTTTTQFWLAKLLRPMGAGIESRYLRQWDGKYWQQTGQHRLPLLKRFAGQCIEAKSSVCIEPRIGCVRISMHSEAGTLEANLIEVGQQADAGIPAWNMKV